MSDILLQPFSEVYGSHIGSALKISSDASRILYNTFVCIYRISFL